eukprot:scaffold2373_cov239-Pinguiococcus_pyrenoidosus.AAC.11
MSFRDLRDFAEILRSLGYQRLVSLENFRTPNFELVADVLYWMVRRYDPSVAISDSIESEDDRVEFLTMITHQLHTKAQVMLNAKKLYAADGHAVKELLKLARMLHQAARAREQSDATEAPPEVSRGEVSRIPDDVKLSRELSSDLLSRGARLHDLLASERQVRRERLQAVRFLDKLGSASSGSAEHRFIESSLRELLEGARENLEAMRKQFEDLQLDEKALASKIKKRTQDLERQEKRLKSLQTVRPAFMDEYDRLAEELQQQYEAYIHRFRNLEYLEHELDDYAKVERERALESERRRRKWADRIRAAEDAMLRGEKDAKDIIVDATELTGAGARAARSGRMAGDDNSVGEDTENSEDASPALSQDSRDDSMEDSDAEIGSKSDSNLDDDGSIVSNDEDAAPYYGGDETDDDDNF